MTDVLREAFDFFDKDKSGKISSSEVDDVLKKGNFEGVTGAQIVAELDKDGDGTISFEEFKAAMEKCQSSS